MARDLCSRAAPALLERLWLLDQGVQCGRAVNALFIPSCHILGWLTWAAATSLLASERVVKHRLTIAIAAVGWALYGFSVLRPLLSTADPQAEIVRLNQAIEEVRSDRDALAAELARFRDEHKNLQAMQKRLSATAQEVKHLEYLRGRVSGEIDAMRPGGSGPSTPHEYDGPTTVESIPLSKQDVSDAQESLTRLGYGPLKADGVVGVGTRRAIEAFQSSRKLSVTGRLNTETRLALRSSQSTR